MFWLLITFAVIFQLPITTASHRCIECAQTLNLNSSDGFSAVRPECKLQNATSIRCMATLRTDYESNNASVSFNGIAEDLFNISISYKIFTHSIRISFDSGKLDSTLQVYCDSNSCIDDITRAYRQSKKLNIKKLREVLQGELFNSSGSADLICDNNQNETVPCPNGLCQLIYNGASGYTRNCIPEGFSAFSPGVIIGTSIVGESDQESPFIYTCNQRMCNNLEMAASVQMSLDQYGLFKQFDTELPVISETTTTTTTTTPIATLGNTAVTMLYQTMIGIQCIVFLVVRL